jgi:hypothetical protein
MLRSLSDSRSSRLGQSLLQMLVVSHCCAQSARRRFDFFSRSYLPARRNVLKSDWRGLSHATLQACTRWNMFATRTTETHSLGPALMCLPCRTGARRTRTPVSTGRVRVHGRRCTTPDAQFALAPSYHAVQSEWHHHG